MKIRRGAKDRSRPERGELEALLKSKAKLKKAHRQPRFAPMPTSTATSGAPRIIEREAAQAIDGDDADPQRAGDRGAIHRRLGALGEGYDIEPGALSYKSGDAFQALARGRSLQPALFIDSTGPHLHAAGALSCPPPRGHGEPLSGRLDPPDGAKFAGGVMIGEPEDLWLLATDAGYGFTRAPQGPDHRSPRRQDGG